MEVCARSMRESSALIMEFIGVFFFCFFFRSGMIGGESRHWYSHTLRSAEIVLAGFVLCING